MASATRCRGASASRRRSSSTTLTDLSDTDDGVAATHGNLVFRSAVAVSHAYDVIDLKIAAAGARQLLLRRDRGSAAGRAAREAEMAEMAAILPHVRSAWNCCSSVVGIALYAEA